MKTETIHVTSLGLGMDEALAVTEKTGLASGLEKKQILRLRLLAEELGVPFFNLFDWFSLLLCSWSLLLRLFLLCLSWC